MESEWESEMESTIQRWIDFGMSYGDLAVQIGDYFHARTGARHVRFVIGFGQKRKKRTS
jgi:hypothetical protein